MAIMLIFLQNEWPALLQNVPMRTQLLMCMMRHPNVLIDVWCCTWMSSSLTGGLVVIICRIGHHSHQTSLCWPSYTYMKNMVHECTMEWWEELLHQIFDAVRCMNDSDTLCKVYVPWSNKSECASKLKVAILNIY
jgi:hypothetical protein